MTACEYRLPMFGCLATSRHPPLRRPYLMRPVPGAYTQPPAPAALHLSASHENIAQGLSNATIYQFQISCNPPSSYGYLNLISSPHNICSHRYETV